MARLSTSDLEALFEFVRVSEAAPDLDSFRAELLPQLRRLIPADAATYTELEGGVPRATCRCDPFELEEVADKRILARFSEEHPIIAHQRRTGDGRAVKLSDFASRRKLRELEVYHAFLHPTETEYRMAVQLPAPAGVEVQIGLNRDSRDFSERDRIVLDHLRPHLVRVYRAITVRMQTAQLLAVVDQTLADSGRAVIALTRRGRIQLSTGRAQAWLKAYFGERRGDRLPTALESWALRSRRAARDGSSAAPFEIDGEMGTLVIRYVPASGAAAGNDALCLEERRAPLGPEVLRGLGLTRREAEVLSELAGGKRNLEIAGSLGITLRTATKHVENIYGKLGVSNRTGAVAKALAAREEAASAGPTVSSP